MDIFIGKDENHDLTRSEPFDWGKHRRTGIWEWRSGFLSVSSTGKDTHRAMATQSSELRALCERKKKFSPAASGRPG